MADTDGLLSIGTFSSLVRISVRMLRYYDQHEILSPALVDPATGYRYYTGDQVRRAVLIRSLRDIGMSVSALAAVITQDASPEVLRRALRAHRGELLAESAALRRRLADLDHMLDHISEDFVSDTSIRTIPAQTILSLRGVIPDHRGQAELWDAFVRSARHLDLPQRPTTGGVTFLDEGYRDSDIDVAVWVPIVAPVSVSAPLACDTTTAHRAVVATHHGPHSGIGATMAEVARHLAAEGLTKTGPISHVYLVGQEQTRNPQDYVTEIRVPV